ncbi:DUF4350 domain-containing protein [Mesorhizobium sp. LHD-90]|uniref:DUF4350 domain-containing protein n=1 Tax=Mesorhizobium sp. LHD-90 TaxID=3071414 RepID=UPI0027E077BF|nr:DUF4350 domain-containing protein [Mesorhizobium sp. LHD-90]MDQ6432800.1 DUF4350 domain-containing protein [Mesorhizobium sp. LHD-90]
MSIAPSPAATESPFNRRVVFWGILASLLAAAGFVLLSTYAPDFRIGRQGGASALSKSGTGFAGLVELMTLLDDEPWTARSIDDLHTDGLLVVTMSPQSDPDALKDIIEARSGMQTLFVLPKWRTIPHAGHEGWEAQVGRLSAGGVDRWLARFVEARLGSDTVDVQRLQVRGGAFPALAPRDLQWAASENAVISAGGNRAVLIEAKDEPFFVLTDPDLLNNAALKDPERAAAAIGLIDMVRPNDEPVAFDLTLHGANRKHDLMKLLLEPPFLALTLAILAAAALALLHGLGRFGPAQAETRAIPFGKRALVDTTARLMRRAGRLDLLGPRYAALMRRRAATILGAPQGLRDDALDRWLEARNDRDKQGYAELAGATRRADNEADLMTAARRLHQWIARRFSERR